MLPFWAAMSALRDSDRRLPGPLVGRIEAEALSALRRKPAQESRLAGALRVLVRYSPELVQILGQVIETIVQRGSLQRPLYTSGIRALAEHGGSLAVEPLVRALGREDAGGLATLSAACLSTERGLSEAIARVAVRRQPHLAFAAEVARLARGECNGANITSIAPKIKESHRIALCIELLVPLLWGRRSLPLAIAPALEVLRSAERHLGRWLVFAELVVRAGDDGPLREARQRAEEGPGSARAAWALVAWALQGGRAEAPGVRPTAELVARLSDRPSADRDMTFLFRLARAGVRSTRPMLENLAKGAGRRQETGLRALPYLIVAHGRRDLVVRLSEVAQDPHKEELRGLATAALFDAGETNDSAGLASTLIDSRQLPTAVWSALVLLAQQGALASPVVSEPHFRWAQLGWVE